MRLSYSGQVCLPSKEDTVSSNLISRSSGQQTRKGFVAIQKNSPFFLPRYLMVGYLGFYFTKALRAFTPMTTTMRVEWNQMVTSTIGVSTFPTGKSLRRPLVTSLHILCSILATLIPTLTAMVGSLQIPAGT